MKTNIDYDYIVNVRFDFSSLTESTIKKNIQRGTKNYVVDKNYSINKVGLSRYLRNYVDDRYKYTVSILDTKTIHIFVQKYISVM